MSYRFLLESPWSPVNVVISSLQIEISMAGSVRVAVLVYLLKDDRRAADERLRKEQEKVEKALQAARNTGDKDREVKELAAQVDSLTVCYRM